jgi:AcrR family transcriptional regulator
MYVYYEARRSLSSGGALGLSGTVTGVRDRSAQKRRTRRAILNAAVELMQQGEKPAVMRVAEIAEVSRRTVYQYFPTQEQLVTEAALEGARGDIERALEMETDDVVARIDTLVNASLTAVSDTEMLMRTMIRLTIEQRLDETRGGLPREAPLRGGRRIEWIETALEPVREQLGMARFERLVSALALIVGIEAFLVLRDIRGLDQSEMDEVSHWAAQALLKASLEERD